jgi:streptogramin lyase
MTTGPDGNLWFVAGASPSADGVAIGKVTTSGEVTEYSLGGKSDADYSVGAIVTGPDGKLWFVDGSRDAIGRSTTDGEVVSFPIPGRRARPTAITVGPDGNLWFTEGAASKIGRITIGGEITEFSLPLGRHPSGIVTGSDGSLWFTQRGIDRIGRITVGGSISEFPIPAHGAHPSAIVAGPDGNLWFAEAGRPAVGRITPLGVVTQFTVPTDDGIDSIIAGRDGLLWFKSRDEVGAISPLGAVSWPHCLAAYCEYPPMSLAVGPDGAIWAGSGHGHCPGLCGGSTEFVYLNQPGYVGAYGLPPLTLAIGPRATAIRSRTSSVVVACGRPDGCAGYLRLGVISHGNGKGRFKELAKGRYDLRPDSARRVRVLLARWAIRSLHHHPGGIHHVRALAGPEGRVEASRGSFELFLRRPANDLIRSRVATTWSALAHPTE